MKKISIIDYGMGNTRSLQASISHFGFNSIITADKKKINNSDLIILPGVGAFPKAMQLLKKKKLDILLKKKFKDGTKIIGICLGMQLLFDSSREIKKTKGIGIIPGVVNEFKYGFNIGWNKIRGKNLDSLAGSLKSEKYYFIHTFKCVPKNKDVITSISNFKGEDFCSSVNFKNAHGFQFHPEKSGVKGLKIIKDILKKNIYV